MFKKKKSILVSIITPNLNGEKYIEDTIKSVISQTNKNFEFIIFDGNSSDNSIKIINKYKNEIDHISIGKDKNQYEAVDKAIKISKGEIIIWINSDDILDKNAVENAISIFAADKSAQWISGINGYIKYNYRYSGIPYFYPNTFITNGYAHQNYWGFIQQESIIFKKKLFYNSGGFKNRFTNASDFHLWKNFSKHSKLKTYYLKIGYFRSWHGQNSKIQQLEYYKDTGLKKSKISLRIFRLLISIILLPYIFIKTKYLLRKKIEI